MNITINHFLVVSFLLFGIGLFGVLARRNFLIVLMSVELMMNAVNLNLVAFSRRLSSLTGQVFSVFVITIAAGEAAIGLALTISLFRQRKTLNVEEADPPTHPRFRTLHTVVGAGSVALSWLFAFGAIFDVGLGRLSEGASHIVTLYRWIPLGVNEAVGQVPGKAAEWFVDAAFRLDSLSALMLAFVTFVGFLIHVYSVGYMGHDKGYGRYFAYLNLFMFAMLVLVLGANFL